MIAAPVLDDDADRVASLRRLGLLDTEPEERFDRITRLAQKIFGVPTALVSLVDADRQWFKSHPGLDATETPRSISFCGHAITGRDVLEVTDATADPRFADNPLVTHDPAIRFYAGCPIASPDGAVIGTLCLIDRQPRQLGDEDRAFLKDLAEMVEHELAVTRLAVDDELTGLANRRGFLLVANQAREFCIRQTADALLLFVDVNGLKVVNDTLGHEIGDELLREAGRILASTFRSADTVARLGGDEFAIFLAGYKGDPMVAVSRLLCSVEERNQNCELLPFALSMAIGTARFDHRTPSSIDELLREADAAMYRNKLRYCGEHRSRVS